MLPMSLFCHIFPPFSLLSMFSALLVRHVDLNLGGVDASAFSDQTLAELRVGDFSVEAKIKYQDWSGVFFDVCDKRGFVCNADGRIKRNAFPSNCPFSIRKSTFAYGSTNATCKTSR